MCLVSFSKTTNYSSLQKVSAHVDKPTWAYIVICDDCTHKCVWCYGGFNKNISNMMPIELFKTIIAKCKEIGIVQVTLSGGEPTEHPDFLEFVGIANDAGFLIHIASHGEHIDAALAHQLKQLNVRQVQFNFQGKLNHDSIHGVAGSYEKQLSAIKELQSVGIETTITVTVGKYNFKKLVEIFKEAAQLNVTRLRVWESTGRGDSFCKDLEAREIFTVAKSAAAGCGYTRSLSYDPDYDGDITIPCLQLSSMFMYVDSKGRLEYCGALPNSLYLADFEKDSSDDILKKYLGANHNVLEKCGVFCAARNHKRLYDNV